MREIAAAVYRVPEAGQAQLASVRRAVRTLAAAGLVDRERLALEDVTYVQQRGAPRRPVPRWEVRIEVCTGAGCPACAAGTFRYAGRAMDLDVIDALLQQNGYIPGQVAAFYHHGWHWTHHQTPGPQRRHPVAVTVSEGCARRATSPQERAAGERALDAYVARFTAGLRVRRT